MHEGQNRVYQGFEELIESLICARSMFLKMTYRTICLTIPHSVECEERRLF